MIFEILTSQGKKFCSINRNKHSLQGQGLCLKFLLVVITSLAAIKLEEKSIARQLKSRKFLWLKSR